MLTHNDVDKKCNDCHKLFNPNYHNQGETGFCGQRCAVIAELRNILNILQTKEAALQFCIDVEQDVRFTVELKREQSGFFHCTNYIRERIIEQELGKNDI